MRSSNDIFLAISSNDIYTVRHMIEQKVEVTVKNKYGETSLHKAVEIGNIDIAEFLIKQKAEINANGKFDQTPLHWAAEDGRNDIIKLLIEKKGEVNVKDKPGQTPLHKAAQKGKTETAKLLIKKNSEVNAKDNSNQTPLHWAAEKGQGDTAKLLIEQKADVTIKSKKSSTLLHSTAKGGLTEIAKFLIAQKAEVNVKDKYGQTPLDLAIEKGQIDTAKLLIEQKSNINKEDIDKWSSQEILDKLLRSLAELYVDCRSVEEMDLVLSLTKNKCRTFINLNMTRKGLTDNDCKTIGKLLNANKEVKEINLSHNHISYAGVRRLVAALPNNSFLKKLDLTANRITCTALLFKKLKKDFLEKKNSVEVVELSQNFMDKDCEEFFACDEKKEVSLHGCSLIYQHSIFRTHARPVTSLLDAKSTITVEKWVVALVCKKQTEHAMLYMEGMEKWGQRFFERYHITGEGIIGLAKILVEDIHLKSYRSNSFYLISNPVDRTDGCTLRDLIEAEKEKEIPFSLYPKYTTYGRTVNCLVWCLSKLKEIDINIEPSLVGLPSQTARRDRCAIQ